MTEPAANAFWTEGPELLRKALEERRSLFDRLVDRLRGASPAQRDEIESEIREMMHEYNPSEEEVNQSLFLLR